jgi:hypothetical protein
MYHRRKHVHAWNDDENVPVAVVVDHLWAVGHRAPVHGGPWLQWLYEALLAVSSFVSHR